MMLPGGSGSSSGESLIEQRQFGNMLRFHPSPVGKLATAGSTHLIREQLGAAVVYAVVVRLDNSISSPITETDQAFLADRRKQKFVRCHRLYCDPAPPEKMTEPNVNRQRSGASRGQSVEAILVDYALRDPKK